MTVPEGSRPIARRAVLAGMAATPLVIGACAQARRGGDVVAAGPPAAILILALAPERLAGWPRRISPDAAALLLDARDLPETGALAGMGRPANPEAILALRPRLILDYGDTGPRYRALATRVERRLDIPYHLVDGALPALPTALRQVGAILGVQDRARTLAERAQTILAAWRKGPSGPRFYYARGSDGLETGFAGSLTTEVLEGGGWINVAPRGDGIGRVSREAIAAWDPEVIVTLDPRFAAAASNDPVWRQGRGGGRRRLLLLPDLPFGWIDRPPSLNRLLGCVWLAGGKDGPRQAWDLAGRLWRLDERFGPRDDLVPRDFA